MILDVLKKSIGSTQQDSYADVLVEDIDEEGVQLQN